MINVSQSFHRTSANAVDDTLTLTKAEMLAVNDNLMPSKYLTVCQDDGYIYLYDKSATPNGTTGKFTKFEGGSGVTNYNDLDNRPQIEGVTLTGNKTAANLGLAKTSDLPSVYAGDTAGLVPAAGSDNEGKYLDNDGNWTVVPMPMIGTINRSDIYDTTEKVVGKWTDGRPVYQRTFAGTLNNANTVGTEIVTLVSVGASVSTYVEVEGFIINGTSNSMQAITTIKKGDYYLRMLAKPNNAANNANNIELYNAWFTSGTNTYVVTAKYTKTTDAANSYNYADENDYSTSEKIIGKWIGGETLYQKTFSVTMPTVSLDGTWVDSTTSVSVGNVNVVDIKGIVTNSAGGIKVFPCYRYTSNLDIGIDVMVTASHYISIASSAANFSGRTAYVTLKYTKS